MLKLLQATVVICMLFVFGLTQAHALQGCTWDDNPVHTYQDASTGFEGDLIEQFTGENSLLAELTALRLVLAGNTIHNRMHCGWGGNSFGHYFCADDGGVHNGGWSITSNRWAYWAIFNPANANFDMYRVFDGSGNREGHWATAILQSANQISYFLDTNPQSWARFWATIKCNGNHTCVNAPNNVPGGVPWYCSPF